MFEQFGTNLVAITNSAAFGTGGTWPYPSPASYYFWAGFVFVFAVGVASLAITWTRRLVGGGVSES